MFVDRAKIHVKAGDGGNGVVAFRREKFVPHGGPNGGDGGRGGDIIFVVDSGLSTLLDFKYRAHYRAKRGEHGRGWNKFGRSGEDLVIRIPPGTVIKDAESGKVLADLVEDGQDFIVAKGGRGGRGNARFASSTHKAPDFAEKGEPGEEFWIILELKLLADVGLIGYPNVGKSTLLSQMTAATPKIANYPFTTLSPNLGVVDPGFGEGASFVLADIPGLIEGAHKGQGLGHEFLRHIERTRLLVHVIDMSGLERDPMESFHAINAELEKYSAQLLEKHQVIAANKMDLPTSRENFKKIKSKLEKTGYVLIPVSGATGEGIQQLLKHIGEMLLKIPKIKTQEYVKHYTVTEEETFKISKKDRVFYISGSKIERLVAMTDLDNESAVKRLQRAFKRMGVDKALEEQDIRQGDTVKIRDFEFYYVN